MVNSEHVLRLNNAIKHAEATGTAVSYPKIEPKSVDMSDVRFDDTVELNEESIVEIVDAEIYGKKVVCEIHATMNSSSS